MNIPPKTTTIKKSQEAKQHQQLQHQQNNNVAKKKKQKKNKNKNKNSRGYLISLVGIQCSLSVNAPEPLAPH